MHHLFVHTAPSRIPRSRTDRKILVAEFAPHAHNLYPLGFVGFNKKFVSHRSLLTCRSRRIIASQLCLPQSERHLASFLTSSDLSASLHRFPVDLRRSSEYLHLYARCSAVPSCFQRAHIRTSRRSRCQILSAQFPRGIIRFHRHSPAKMPPAPSNSTNQSLAPRKSCACPAPTARSCTPRSKS